MRSAPERHSTQGNAPYAPGVSSVEWNVAAEQVKARAHAHAAAKGGRVCIVGITGPVGSGKSTLASKLGGCLIGTDQYLPDYELVPYEERDDPKHADLDRLCEDVRLLRDGRAARVPIWSFHEHKRVGEVEITPTPLIVLEGLFALHERVRPLVDVAVFVEAPAAERWRRWAAIEESGERGWGVDAARLHFDRVAEPTFERYAAIYRAGADLVVRNP